MYIYIYIYRVLVYKVTGLPGPGYKPAALRREDVLCVLSAAGGSLRGTCGRLGAAVARRDLPPGSSSCNKPKGLCGQK